MDILICVLILFFLSVSAFAFFLLIHILVIKTEQVTEFLAVTDWFGRYSKISQRIRLKSFVVSKTRAAYKYKPIREMLKAFGQLFEEDFEKLFPKLQPGVTYRVVTHYNNIMEKAAAEHKIVLIGKAKKLHTRFLKEIRPLVGLRDYRIIKQCFRKQSNKDRCCEKCDEHQKCQCQKGGICKRLLIKIFREYFFVVDNSENK